MAFSASKLACRCLKLNFGSRFLIDDIPLDEEGPGELFPLESEGLGVNRKFTLLGVGVGVGVGGIFICTNSWRETSIVLVGISKKRFDFLQCLAFVTSSADPEELST